MSHRRNATCRGCGRRLYKTSDRLCAECYSKEVGTEPGWTRQHKPMHVSGLAEDAFEPQLCARCGHGRHLVYDDCCLDCLAAFAASKLESNGRCRACGGEIRFETTAKNGKSIPLNPEPAAQGRGNAAFDQDGLIVYVHNDERWRFKTMYEVHFATCLARRKGRS